MLEPAAELAGAGLLFEPGDIAQLAADGSWDVVFANASLQWVPDHPALFSRMTGALRARGQLAVQMPANFDHPTHTVADEVGAYFGMAPLARFEAILATPRSSTSSAYREARLAALGDPPGERPCTYPFKRLLLWGRRG